MIGQISGPPVQIMSLIQGLIQIVFFSVVIRPRRKTIVVPYRPAIIVICECVESIQLSLLLKSVQPIQHLSFAILQDGLLQKRKIGV